METGFNTLDDVGKEKKWKRHRKKFVTGREIFLLTLTAMATNI
jgi:hypothetical protein